MFEILFKLMIAMSATGALGMLLLWLMRPALETGGPGIQRGGLLAAAVLFVLPLPLLGARLGGLLLSQTPATPALSGQHTAPTMQRIGQMGAAVDEALRAPIGEVFAGAPAGASLADSPARPPLTVWQALALAYGLGLLVCLAVWAVRYILFSRRLAKSCRPVEKQGILDAYAALCTEMQVAKPPLLMESEEVSAPLLAGLWRPKLVLTTGLLEGDRLEFALRHELVHHKQHDLPLKMGMLLVSILHWFNPAATLLRRDFAEACERACDGLVAGKLNGGGRRAYACTLLDFAGRRQEALCCGFASPAQKLKKRMKGILHPAKPGPAKRSACMAALCAVVLVATLAGCAGGAAGSQSLGQSLPSSAGVPNVVGMGRDEAISQLVEAQLQHVEQQVQPVLTSGGTSGSEVVIPLEPENIIGPDTIYVKPLRPEEGLPAAPPEGQRMSNPVPDATFIIRGFGDEGHRGIDFEAPKSSPIYASGKGMVVDAMYTHYSYGAYVTIEYENGLRVLYAHCDELKVFTHGAVDEGTVIATVGQSGMSTGVHCHVEVMAPAGSVLMQVQRNGPKLFVNQHDATGEYSMSLPVGHITGTTVAGQHGDFYLYRETKENGATKMELVQVAEGTDINALVEENPGKVYYELPEYTPVNPRDFFDLPVELTQ